MNGPDGFYRSVIPANVVIMISVVAQLCSVPEVRYVSFDCGELGG